MAENISPPLVDALPPTESAHKKPNLKIGKVIKSAFVAAAERAVAQIDLGETPEPDTFSEIVNEVMSGANVMARYKSAMEICKQVLAANSAIFSNRQITEFDILSLLTQPYERGLMQAFARMQIDSQSGNGLRKVNELRSLTALLAVTNGLARINKSRTRQADWIYSGKLDSSARVGGGDFKLEINEKTAQSYEEKGTLPEEIVFYQERKVIRRDSTIEGGVYVVSDGNGSGLFEATVVNSLNDQKLQNAYISLLQRLDASLTSTTSTKEREQKILWTIYQLVLETIPYNMDKTLKAESMFPPGTKINLGSFFGGGVCRHQALLIGWLTEKLISDKVLSGKISLERNQIINKGGHSWARFTSNDGSVTILDAAQNYVGTIFPSDEDQTIWNYARPEEKPLPKHVEQSKTVLKVRDLLRKQRNALKGDVLT